jgi:FdhE protein
MADGGLVGGGSLGEAPYLRPHPGARALFSLRAERFAALARGHAAGDYLGFLSALATAQAVAAARLHAPPPIAAAGRPLDLALGLASGWRETLGPVLDALAAADMPEPARAALARLRRLPAAALDRLGEHVLHGDPLVGPDVAAAPVVGAALQVIWAGRAEALPADAVPRVAEGCPACGAPPVVGVVLGDDRLRYLVCGLCATQWHHTRVQCVLCRSAARLSYFTIEGEAGPAKAEACDRCQAYLKLLYVEQAPRLEPVADDVASLALDLLMAEKGYQRLGPNPLLVVGEVTAEA